MSLRPHPLETLLTALAGWMPLLGGLTLLAITLITPEWLAWRELVWQRDMLRLQAQGLEKQAAGYNAFYDALAADDPILLERLAFTHLRYKPTGKRLMGDIWLASSQPAGPNGASPPAAGISEMIESWLATPQPVVGRDIQPLRPINSRMTRMTRGPSRYVLLLVAIICLVAGLWPESQRAQTDAEKQDPQILPPGPPVAPQPRLSLVLPPRSQSDPSDPVRKRA